MDALSARNIISEYIKEQFGRLTELREIAVERSSSGRVWQGSVYCVTGRGDVLVGSVGVAEDGQICRELNADALIEALTALGREPGFEANDLEMEQDFSGFAEEVNPPPSAEEAAEIDLFFSEFNSAKLMGNIIGLLASGEKEDLLKARRLMPQLLVDHENRGTVLRYMGELEIRLGEYRLGVEYLEAAACEFADVGDVESLRRTADIASRLKFDDTIDTAPIKRLLEQTLVRLSPVEDLANASVFGGLSPESKQRLASLATLEQFDHGAIVLAEGAPAVRAYVIQSGILGVSLETPGGEKRTVRCCFPGELVGESCVQGEGATCNATVFAQKPCTLWRFEGSALASAYAEIPELRSILDAGRTIHRLDSFFSMNNATSTLDVRVRDRIIGCISSIRYVREGEVLERSGTLPESVYLVLTGGLSIAFQSGSRRMYQPDEFACLRDTLHKLPLEGDVTVSRSGKLITFDPEALFNLAVNAPPEVVAVLERLE